jgi:hypothetical protein
MILTMVTIATLIFLLYSKVNEPIFGNESESKKEQ